MNTRIIAALLSLFSALMSFGDEVFFPVFREGPFRHQLVRAKDGKTFDLKYSAKTQKRPADDLDALDVRIKRANDHGKTNRFVLIGKLEANGDFVLREWYLICPFLDDRERDWDHRAEPKWTKELGDDDFAKLVNSPLPPHREYRRNYVIRKGEYCRYLVKKADSGDIQEAQQDGGGQPATLPEAK